MRVFITSITSIFSLPSTSIFSLPLLCKGPTSPLLPLLVSFLLISTLGSFQVMGKSHNLRGSTITSTTTVPYYMAIKRRLVPHGRPLGKKNASSAYQPPVMPTPSPSTYDRGPISNKNSIIPFSLFAVFSLIGAAQIYYQWDRFNENDINDIDFFMQHYEIWIHKTALQGSVIGIPLHYDEALDRKSTNGEVPLNAFYSIALKSFIFLKNEERFEWYKRNAKLWGAAYGISVATMAAHNWITGNQIAYPMFGYSIPYAMLHPFLRVLGYSDQNMFDHFHDRNSYLPKDWALRILRSFLAANGLLATSVAVADLLIAGKWDSNYYNTAFALSSPTLFGIWFYIFDRLMNPLTKCFTNSQKYLSESNHAMWSNYYEVGAIMAPVVVIGILGSIYGFGPAAPIVGAAIIREAMFQGMRVTMNENTVSLNQKHCDSRLILGYDQMLVRKLFNGGGRVLASYLASVPSGVLAAIMIGMVEG